MNLYIRRPIKRLTSWLSYNPPGALSSKGWRLFDKEFSEQAPIRYWVKKTFKKKVLLPIKWKYDEIKSYFRYRLIDRYHIIDTGLPPNYYDTDTLMLHVNFNLLKDFVEVEIALHTYWFSEAAEKAGIFEKYMPFYYKFVPFRSPALGLQHLDWAATLDDPSLPIHERSDHQAQSAREIKELYLWWVTTRPARKEIEYIPYSNQGFGTLGCFDDDFDKEAEDYKASRQSSSLSAQQKEEWDNEDTEMLCRLIKIRRALWT